MPNHLDEGNNIFTARTGIWRQAHEPIVETEEGRNRGEVKDGKIMESV